MSLSDFTLKELYDEFNKRDKDRGDVAACASCGLDDVLAGQAMMEMLAGRRLT